MAFDGRLYGIPNSLFSKSNVRSNHGTNAVQVIEIGNNQDTRNI